MVNQCYFSHLSTVMTFFVLTPIHRQVVLSMNLILGQQKSITRNLLSKGNIESKRLRTTVIHCHAYNERGRISGNQKMQPKRKSRDVGLKFSKPNNIIFFIIGKYRLGFQCSSYLGILEKLYFFSQTTNSFCNTLLNNRLFLSFIEVERATEHILNHLLHRRRNSYATSPTSPKAVALMPPGM